MSQKTLKILEPFESLEFKIPAQYQGESLVNKIQKSPYSVSFILDHSIDKCWTLARDISKLVNEINPAMYSDFKLYLGTNTWELGNIYTFDWNGLTKINCKVIYVEDTKFKKKISWYCKMKIGINYINTYYLYKISEVKKTLIKNIIILDHTSNVEMMNFSENEDYYRNIHLKRLKDYNEYLNKTVQKFSYVSCLINSKALDIWNFAIDLKKMSKFFPSFGTKFKLRNNENKVGSFWKCEIPSYNKFCYIRIRNIVKSENKNNWVYHCDTMGTINNIPQREMKIIVTRVMGNNNGEKCQLAVAHLFKERIQSEALCQFNNNNNYFLKELRLYLTNNLVKGKSKNIKKSKNNNDNNNNNGGVENKNTKDNLSCKNFI